MRNGDDVLVLGAGVIGLTTAVCLAEAGARIRLWAADLPPATTSVAAGALWGPDFTEPGFGWSLVTRDELTALASEPSSGVRLCRGREVSDLSAELPPWVDELPELRVCEPDELPEGMLVGLWTTVPVVNMPVYLDYLTRRLADAGVEIERRRVATLAEAAARAPVVVNCTGVGAVELAGDTDLHPVRGQHVVVENPGIDEFYIAAGLAPQWAGYIPHGDHVVLGGVAIPHDWSLEPDPAIAEGIVARCAAIEPRLAGARVIEHRVGLRPQRTRPRLDEEPVDGARCVHNYGHGGMGVSLSWGCARAVRNLLAG
ncbi:MAG TPA: FAD-dependent oxidoreductase [Actinophytocola sp.]|uniref:FAD-dependent oxidoreductase n=1 Tax=Actinophytocola sp. TaxID=1872138 RepID=UPI002DDCE87D|nr:FAD-dependent oxidoreductase [Actinophytocola sp.]HEV2782332.1 FAD-dependent oxidoreductase [Actinophytocola sp.]